MASCLLASTPLPLGGDHLHETQEELWSQERTVLLLLLEARVLLKAMLLSQPDHRSHGWGCGCRLYRDNISLIDIHDQLKQDPPTDLDCASELGALKRQVIAEIKLNHALNANISRLDVKISLLIHNRSTTHELATKRREMWITRWAARAEEKQRLRKQQSAEATSPYASFSAAQLHAFGEMFYALQTEPKYLASCMYVMQPTEVDSLLHSTILTLFGEAFSPREEYLLLNVIAAAVQREIAAVKNVRDFIAADSVVSKLLLAYNQRVQGTTYLDALLTPLFKSISSLPDLHSPSSSSSSSELESVCERFLRSILLSLPAMPYGLRWICKIMSAAIGQDEESSFAHRLAVLGYFVFYRFINVGLLRPESVMGNNAAAAAVISTKDRLNLLAISKVLQKCFNLKQFSSSSDPKQFVQMNAFVTRSREQVIKFYDSLVAVSEPEDHLQVDQYNEMIHQQLPSILISPSEMLAIYRLIAAHLDSIASAEDPLRQIIKEIGATLSPDPVAAAPSSSIQLALQSRLFKKQVKEDELAAILYIETKELCMSVLRCVPLKPGSLVFSIPDLLDFGSEYAAAVRNHSLAEKLSLLRSNLDQLEKTRLVNSADGYAQFVQDLFIAVANRAVIRERQKKEIARLTGTLRKLQTGTKFALEQLAEYERFLRDALCKQTYAAADEKPRKFDYKKLDELSVIIDSSLPLEQLKQTKFVFSVVEAGVFELVCKTGSKKKANIVLDKYRLHLDELLEKNSSQVERLELAPHFVLDVTATLLLLNKYLLV